MWCAGPMTGAADTGPPAQHSRGRSSAVCPRRLPGAASGGHRATPRTLLLKRVRHRGVLFPRFVLLSLSDLESGGPPGATSAPIGGYRKQSGPGLPEDGSAIIRLQCPVQVHRTVPRGNGPDASPPPVPAGTLHPSPQRLLFNSVSPPHMPTLPTPGRVSLDLTPASSSPVALCPPRPPVLRVVHIKNRCVLRCLISWPPIVTGILHDSLLGHVSVSFPGKARALSVSFPRKGCLSEHRVLQGV